MNSNRPRVDPDEFMSEREEKKNLSSETLFNFIRFSN